MSFFLGQHSLDLRKFSVWTGALALWNSYFFFFLGQQFFVILAFFFFGPLEKQIPPKFGEPICTVD
jgi:hypothetical protein